jgi:hypothetical protein
MNGSDALAWTEEDVTFRRDSLSGKRFSEVLKTFQRFVRITRENFLRETYALQREDAWHARQLGPTSEGKLASNTYWYAYFSREGNSWKLRELEIVYH